MSSNSPRSPIENTASSDAGVVTDDVVVSTALGNLGLSETNKETFVPLNEEQGCPMEVEVENLQVAPLTHEEARKALQEETELLNNKNTYVATLMAQKRRLGENAAIDISISTAIAEIQKKDAQVKQWQSIVMGFESVARTQRCLEPVHIAQSLGHSSVSKGTNGKVAKLELGPNMPRYHRLMEIMPKIDSKISGPLRTNVRAFLHEFKKQGQWEFGQEQFATVCLRLLCMANLDEKARDAFDAAIDQDPGGEWGWERCEQVFVDSALTMTEKAAEVDDFAKAGREKNETYKEFANRLRRLVEVYKVRELPKHSDVAQSLRMSIPSLALTVMQVAEMVKRLVSFVGMPMPDTESLDFLMDAIPNVHGPDDSGEWKTVIEASRKRKQAKEVEEQKQAQPQKEKQQPNQFQKKKNTSPGNGNGNSSSNANAIPINNSSTYQGQANNNGQQGKFKNKTWRNHENKPYNQGELIAAVDVAKENVEHVNEAVLINVVSVHEQAQNNKVAKEQAEHKTGNGGIRFIKAGSVPEKVAVGDDVDVVAIVEGEKVNGRKGKRQRGRKYRSLDAETNDNPSPPTLEGEDVNGSVSENSVGGTVETEKKMSRSDSSNSEKAKVSHRKKEVEAELCADVLHDDDSSVHANLSILSAVVMCDGFPVVKQKEMYASPLNPTPQSILTVETLIPSQEPSLQSSDGTVKRINSLKLSDAANFGVATNTTKKRPFAAIRAIANNPCIAAELPTLLRQGIGIFAEDEVTDAEVNAKVKMGMNEKENAEANADAILHFNSSKKDAKMDNRLFVHVRIMNELHMALIDTGATHSFISTAIVKKYSMKVNPTRGYIQLADRSLIARIGETENVEVICGEMTLSAPYEVIEQDHALTIGMDLFHRFGFNLVGLPDPEMSTAKVPPPVEDEKPTLIPLAVPEVEKTKEFVQEKKEFMRVIKKALEDNAKIPKASYCPVPEMKVYLDVPPGVTLFRRPRSFAAAQMPILDEAVKTWLEDDVITLAPPGNAYNNTLTLAAKKDADGNKTLYRVCLDPRPLNALLPDDRFPVPLISDIMNFAGGNEVFSTIDLRQAYHRLPIHEHDRKLTAFMHGGTQYMFKKAPFGLKPLSSLFQRGMSRILGDLPFVRNFIDDILIASKNRAEHAIHVKTVIERLTKAKLIINVDKCKFYCTQVALLGFIIDVNGKRCDPSKLANIDEWKPPTTGKQVMSYMGTFNFFREYVPLISTIAAPLDALRNRPGTFRLNALQLKCFNALKRLLTQAPILHFPDFSLPFHVATDASNYGIGAVLYQLPGGEQDPKNIRYICFVARALQPSERNYSATQRELLAIVFALKRLHYYLWHRHFTLYTDHRALTFMHSQKEMNSMLTAWQETILDYNFKVVYRPGVLNVLPDALSRQFPSELWTDRIAGTAPVKLYGYTHLIQDGNTPRITVTVPQREQVLADVHGIGHFGANAMVKRIHSMNKTWPDLVKHCLEFVQRCRQCQRVNIARKGYHPLAAIYANLPGEHMAVDLAGPFPVESEGNRFLLVLVDVCTRFVFFRPIPNKETLTIARTLYDIFTTIGFPRVLQSDNGKEFVSQIMDVMATEMGMQHRLVTPYHPRGNGVAENHVKTACNIIRKEVEDRKESWARHVPNAQMAMNTRMVALHNSSPFSLFFARRFDGITQLSDATGVPATEEDLLKRLEYMTEVVFPAIQEKTRDTQRKMIERFNKTVLHNEFPDGARVMSLDPIKGDKLAPRYEGPYTVVRRTTGGSYVLKDGTGAELGRNFAPSQLKLVLDDFEATETYEVEKILDHRDIPGEGVEYLVHWKGYGSKDRTWEPPGHFVERQCIADYWKSRSQPGKHTSPQPRQNSKRPRLDQEEQELSSEQQRVNQQPKAKVTKNKSSKVPKGTPKKKGRPRKNTAMPVTPPAPVTRARSNAENVESNDQSRVTRVSKRRRT